MLYQYTNTLGEKTAENFVFLTKNLFYNKQIAYHSTIFSFFAVFLLWFL